VRGLHRSTLLVNPKPAGHQAGEYLDTVTNPLRRTIHRQMADGKAYAFAFDDVGARSPW